MATINRQFSIRGMHCTGCEEIIGNAVRALPGVSGVEVSYGRGVMSVDYDSRILADAEIGRCLAEKGYTLEPPAKSAPAIFKQLMLFGLLLALVGGVAFWGKSLMPGVMMQIKPQMSYALLLGIGFMTGFHCIGMCGGFVVGYTDPAKSKAAQLLAHLGFAFGKTLSYTVLGAGFGLLGASIAITPQIRGGLALAASVFLLLYGLKMLDVFAFLRRFTLRMPSLVNRGVAGEMRRSRRSGLRSGLLTGLLLGCGPLQAMYVMAAGSGDPLQGGMILMMFGLGTLLPLMGFGIFASLLPQTAMRLLLKVSGILVMAMGLMMAQRGLMTLKAGGMPPMPMSPPSMQAPH